VRTSAETGETLLKDHRGKDKKGNTARVWASRMFLEIQSMEQGRDKAGYRRTR
jgi:hypothetical protein